MAGGTPHHESLLSFDHETIPMRKYDRLFTTSSPKKHWEKQSPEALRNNLTIMQKRSIEVFDSLRAENLDCALYSTDVQHSMAKTKFDALDWNIKHAMWHCGQLGILVRIAGERFNFGLRREPSWVRS